MKLISLLGCGVALLGTLAGCGGGGGGGGPPLPPSRSAETLVYVASDGISVNGMDELFAVEDDGTGQRRLSSEAVLDNNRVEQVTVSPDGQWVAYIAKASLLADALYVAPTALRVSAVDGANARIVSGAMLSELYQFAFLP